MLYVPEGYSILGLNKMYWRYTPDEEKVLFSRELSRMNKLHKTKSTKPIDLTEKTPLWELMGKTKEEWNKEHYQNI